MTEELGEQVVEALDEVLDPCSCMTDHPMSIVDLGLVDDVGVEGTSVRVRLLPTTPMCMYMPQIMDEAEAKIRKVDGVDVVEVTENVQNLWRPERMADHLRADREARLGSRLEEVQDGS
jgi:ATP-binding protein involved in chromosome partitioning